MKLQLSFLVSSLLFSTFVLGRVTLEKRQDGDSGDGDCDPCDESCEIFSKRDEKFIPRMLEFNDTRNWEKGESVRWRKTAPGPFDKRQQMLMLEFDCTNLPEICNNICFGLFCNGKNLQQTLTINRANCPAARKSNSCGSSNPNYCSAKSGFASGYSCDEYPFASTVEGKNAGGNTATRCVPKNQNSAQGGFISGLYRNGQGQGRLADGTQFLVDLGNPGTPGVEYCVQYSGGTTDCTAEVGDQNSKGSQR